MKLKIGVCLLMGATLFLSGCGYKDNPLPPQEVVPKAIGDLHYQLGEDSVKLSWTYPVETIKGGQIEDISNFELYRAGVPVDEYCASCPIPFGKPQSLPGGETLDGEKRRVATFEAGGLKSGYKYFFKVSSRNGWWAESEASNVVSFIYAEPPAAPAGLRGIADDGKVVLSWAAVLSMKNGSALPGSVKYEVLRNGARFAGPMKATVFTDTKVKNGQKYKYAVQTVMDFDGESVYSDPSNTISVSPMDKQAPDPLTGVRAVASGKDIKVFWDGSSASDLKEYRIYRRAYNEKKYAFIDRVEPTFTIYVDDKINNAIRYYYVVTAVDAAGNESAHSAAVTTRD